MDPNISNELENQLQGQLASGLDSSLLNRLEAAADGSLTDLSTVEQSFESKLRNIRPISLQPDLMERLAAKSAKVYFPTETQVVAFPGKLVHKAPQRRSWLSAAAAVALLGALSAILINPLSPSAQTAGGDSAGSQTAQQVPAPAMVQPAQFSRALSETYDEGIIWPANQDPHRVVKVVYTDRVSMKRKDGSTYEVEKPRVEYYVVPTHSH